MDGVKLKRKMALHAGEFLTALLLIQPLLDVLSYFMQEAGATAVTTALRTFMLFAVVGYGFCVSDNKRVYGIALGIIGGFWILHMANCFRLGYVDPVGDAGEYCKLMQFPLWTLAFVSLFRCREGLDVRAAGLLALGLGVVVLVICLSFLTGLPVYTYDIPALGVRMGVLGWFGVANAQSAIVCLLTAGFLAWAFGTGRVWIFSLACLAGFGLLYFTGTRLAYYSAILLAFGLLVLVLLSWGNETGKRALLFCIPLVLALGALFALKGVSIMERRQALTGESYQRYQEQSDAILDGLEEADLLRSPPTGEALEKITRVYEEVYSQRSLADTPLLGDLLDRFGTQRVMEYYHYTTKASILYNVRTKKLAAMGLTWEEQDLATKILGFEYSHATINGSPYDPENDFSALPYYYGYLGTALYTCFAAGVLLMLLFGCLANLRRLPKFLTVELGVFAMMYCLGLGAAQLSGNVLRRPSVSVYLALAAAEMYVATHAGSGGKLRAKIQRRPELRQIETAPVSRWSGQPVRQRRGKGSK